MTGPRFEASAGASLGPAGVSAGVSLGVSIGRGGPSGIPTGAGATPLAVPLHVFRFHVHFAVATLSGGADGAAHPICGGAFAECSGLEATMEPKVIKEGGRNFGAAQRAGPVTFGTVVLKRGLTTARDMWTWFDLVTNRHAFAHRLAATINIYDHGGNVAFAWHLTRAMPVKFKGADLNARGSEVGVEELHLAHEGLTLVRASHDTIDAALTP